MSKIVRIFGIATMLAIGAGGAMASQSHTQQTTKTPAASPTTKTNTAPKTMSSKETTTKETTTKKNKKESSKKNKSMGTSKSTTAPNQ